MMRTAIVLASLTALAACGNPAPDQQAAGPAPAGNISEQASAISGQAPVGAVADAQPRPVLDPAALESRRCSDVARFYALAVQSGDFASAEKVWGPSLLPAGGLAKQFAFYRTPKLQMGEGMEEGAAGSLYCEVPVTLLDGADPARKPASGTITFRRVNDVDGATPEQLRWHIERSEIAGIEP